MTAVEQRRAGLVVEREDADDRRKAFVYYHYQWVRVGVCGAGSPAPARTLSATELTYRPYALRWDGRPS